MVRLLLLLLFAPLFAFAEVSLVSWQPEGFSRAFILSAREGESPAAARERYLKSLELDPELKLYAQELRKAGEGKLGKFESPRSPFVAVLANDQDDLQPAQRRIHRVGGPLKKKGAAVMVIPVAVTSGLDAKEAGEFRRLLNREVDLLMAVGGDDIHPSLYGDKDPKRLSRNTVLARDKEEAGIVRSYLDEGKGFFSGICRGHQMGGVAAGCRLIKDIETELKLDHPRQVSHDITPHQPGELTRRLFGDAKSLEVTSNHHQAVVVPSRSNKKIQVTALSAQDKKIAEISEYAGGRGLSVQGHPEDISALDFHQRYYDLVFEEAKAANQKRLSGLSHLRFIDVDKTLFGVEYTFQDQGMVDEPGRMTMETPHKRKKFNLFHAAYLEELGVGKDAVGRFGREDFKPGKTIKVRGDGEHVMNMEPVTIEVNTPPKTYPEIEAAAEKIYRASAKADLVPYVQPAAERSGMGHIHVGAAKIGDSPFYKNPRLLRNLMVLQHKHPSLLWGFAEAYDIGPKSNIESHHGPERRAGFERAVKNFDKWFETTRNAGGDLSDGLRQFLLALQKENQSAGYGASFFDHYRFMNLEHIAELADPHAPIDPERAGKFTVEFRNFRPPKTPAHAKSYAELLLTLMDKMAEPGHLEEFEVISEADYQRFHSATKVAGDWEKVKKSLGHHNPLWDESVNEYVAVQAGAEKVRATLPTGATAEIIPAFSPKGQKGQKFEIRLPAKGAAPPRLEVANQILSFEKVRAGGKSYWVSVFDTNDNFSPEVVRGLAHPAICADWFRVLQ